MPGALAPASVPRLASTVFLERAPGTTALFYAVAPGSLWNLFAMAADGQTTILPATEWTYRRDGDRPRAVEMLLRDPLWSLLDDEAIASIAEVSPDVVRDHRRTLRKVLG